MPTQKRLCMVSRIPGVAGPSSFQRRLQDGLEKRGIEVCYGLEQLSFDAVLVIGGTRQVAGLRRVKRSGIPVLQRLNGMNWIHRQRRTGIKHYVRAEINNFLLRWVRRSLADVIVYQSQFAREWWQRSAGVVPQPDFVVHNGVPLDQFTPQGPGEPPQSEIRVLMVEGNLAGGYEIGLAWGTELIEKLRRGGNKPLKLSVAGKVTRSLRERIDAEGHPVEWLGEVPPAEIPKLMRSAHILYSADVNPACPNSVIEAMACGLPVVALDTGALPELVQDDAGVLSDYGGDPWRLEPPHLTRLAEIAQDVFADLPRYERGARLRAEAAFGLDKMVDGYLNALGWL